MYKINKVEGREKWQMTKQQDNYRIGIREVIFFLSAIGLVVLIVAYWGEIYGFLTQKEKLENWINSFGNLRFIIFILIQILQVVIFVIPGEVVYVAGGYLFGSILSSVLSVIGITLGSLLCFGAARILGQPLVQTFIAGPKMDKLKAMINTKQASVTLFMIYVIPGLPGKDALAYVAGVTPMRFMNFFLVTLIARSPWIIVASIWGSNLEKGNYTALIVVTVVVAVVFLLGIWKGENLVKYVSDRFKNLKSR